MSASVLSELHIPKTFPTVIKIRGQKQIISSIKLNSMKNIKGYLHINCTECACVCACVHV